MWGLILPGKKNLKFKHSCINFPRILLSPPWSCSDGWFLHLRVKTDCIKEVLTDNKISITATRSILEILVFGWLGRKTFGFHLRWKSLGFHQSFLWIRILKIKTKKKLSRYSINSITSSQEKPLLFNPQSYAVSGIIIVWNFIKN